MPVTIKTIPNDDMQHPPVEVLITGKLEREDYELFGPMIEEKIRESGKLKILINLVDFHGWTFGGLWEDIKFDVRHFNDIDRLAVVGDRKWQEGMAKFCRPFTTASVLYFEPDQIDEARSWLQEETHEERQRTMELH